MNGCYDADAKLEFAIWNKAVFVPWVTLVYTDGERKKTFVS